VIAAAVLALAALLATQDAPPAAASAIIAALDAGDARAVQATLAQDAPIMDEHGQTPAPSTAVALTAFLQGCLRIETNWEVDADDPGRTALTLSWICASRGRTDTYVWLENGKVAFLQFGRLASPAEGGSH
jgi:hypothetical protein